MILKKLIPIIENIFRCYKNATGRRCLHHVLPKIDFTRAQQSWNLAQGTQNLISVSESACVKKKFHHFHINASSLSSFHLCLLSCHVLERQTFRELYKPLAVNVFPKRVVFETRPSEAFRIHLRNLGSGT